MMGKVECISQGETELMFAGCQLFIQFSSSLYIFCFFSRSLSIPRPTDETLNRHSILGPNGLRGQLQLPASDRGV